MAAVTYTWGYCVSTGMVGLYRRRGWAIGTRIELAGGRFVWPCVRALLGSPAPRGEGQPS